ncbi:unnamed protein product [Lactuca saligna]|uniref:Uncharacterized protein n=1 Tax=Lactuca saligna TaxID=75948 RepID=A0AA36EBX7_LACSI|nr:unnamed protein product [Lactuca saligna]
MKLPWKKDTRLGLIFARKEGYVEIHRIIIPILSLSSKIINIAHTKDDLHVTVGMQKWIYKPYLVESSYSEEENDEDDNEEGDGNKERADQKEDIDDDKKELATDKGEDLAQGMNSLMGVR